MFVHKFLFNGVIVLSLILFSFIVYSQTDETSPYETTDTTEESDDDFRIKNLLQNENNKDILGFEVFGSFEKNDILNLFLNDTLIKGKVIDEEGVTDTTIKDVSTDLFQIGISNLVVKLERAGTIIDVTPAYEVSFVPELKAPIISILNNEEEKNLSLTISGDYFDEDVVVLSLNASEFERKTITPETLSVDDPSIEFTVPYTNFTQVENIFSAHIERKGEIGPKTDQRYTFEEEEEVVEEVVVEESLALMCLEYAFSKKFTGREDSKGDNLGISLKVKGDKIVSGTSNKSLYIYRKISSGWFFNSRIIEQIPVSNNIISKKIVVDIEGDAIFAGLPISNYGKYISGGAHIYENRFSPDTTSFLNIIPPANPTSYGYFGRDIAADNNILVTSDSSKDNHGSVYVYSRLDNGWSHYLTINTADTEEDFGHSVAIYGLNIAVGAPDTYDSAESGGSVYLYDIASDTVNLRKIASPVDDNSSTFGYEVHLSGDLLFIGSPESNKNIDGKKRGGGAVYIYRISDESVNLVDVIHSPVEGSSQRFGHSIDYSKGLLVVGDPNAESDNYHSGATYIYVEEGGNWNLKDTVTHEDAGKKDLFGEDVSFDGETLVVGAPGDDSVENNSGAIYIYDVNGITCVDESEVVSEEEMRLKNLEVNKSLLEVLKTSIDFVSKNINDALKKSEEEKLRNQRTYIIFDESDVSLNAQKKAAELRGLVGPNIPILRKVEIITEEVVLPDVDPEVAAAIAPKKIFLSLGTTHNDVLKLQKFLNENGYVVARSGDGSIGNEYTYFDSATEKALKSFQLINGLPATGVLDDNTRKVILIYMPSF